jgi:phosphoserine phosphatase
MKKFDAIAFDLDSTLVTIEGLDWLAHHKGVAGDVVQLTEASMNGEIPVEMAFEKKMALIAPSHDDVSRLGKMYVQSFVADAKEVIAALQYLGKEVWIVTGNFNPAPQIAAEFLHIPPEHVINNTMLFDGEKRYAGYVKTHPLARNGGKAAMVKEYIKKDGKRVAFVGDAITDLETKPFVDLFIGFGGVAERKAVKEAADVFITAPTLKPLLDIVLTDREKSMLQSSSARTLLLQNENSYITRNEWKTDKQ